MVVEGCFELVGWLWGLRGVKGLWSMSCSGMGIGNGEVLGIKRGVFLVRNGECELWGLVEGEEEVERGGGVGGLL